MELAAAANLPINQELDHFVVDSITITFSLTVTRFQECVLELQVELKLRYIRSIYLSMALLNSSSLFMDKADQCFLQVFIVIELQ